jgi:NADPH2:quinone reductase
MPDMLQVERFDAPPRLVKQPKIVPGAGEILVRIHACGLNFADLLMLKGTYQDTPALPFVPGIEAAGVVESHGPDVDAPHLAPGTRVAVGCGHGGLARHGTFSAARCIPLPDGMPFEQAAGFQVAYGTSHLALDHAARLKPGETLLVLGAAGGVGLTAVEIGKLMGARVIAVARGAAKLEIARAAGADHLIDSEDDDLRATVKALGGADVVYDPVGGDSFLQAMRATRPGGRMIVIGFAAGKVQQVPANLLLVKNIAVIGFYWGGFRRFAPELLDASLVRLFDWYREGRLSPHIGATLPLERVAEGMEMMRTRRSTGKVVITMP